MKKVLFPALLLLALVGCNEETEVETPPPIAMTKEAVGHYCNMNIFEHSGPKAQIHLEDIRFPIWFSQVRDAIAFMRLPEETQRAVAVYVHDMALATNWDQPGDDIWIDINQAYFVIGSRFIGGMGAPETIPFGSREAAQSFANHNGGDVVRIGDIPDEYVLGPVEINNQLGQVEHHKDDDQKTGSIQ